MINRKIYVYVMILLFILLGCENNKSAATNTDQMVAITEYHSSNYKKNMDFTGDNISNNTETNNEANNLKSKQQLRFTKFLLNIDYENDQTIEIKYEKKSFGIETKIVDTQTKEKVIGKEAFAKIQPLLLELKIRKGTPASDVKHEIISLFNIRDDYQKIELCFTDGIEKEFTFHP